MTWYNSTWPYILQSTHTLLFAFQINFYYRPISCSFKRNPFQQIQSFLLFHFDCILYSDILKKLNSNEHEGPFTSGLFFCTVGLYSLSSMSWHYACFSLLDLYCSLCTPRAPKWKLLWLNKGQYIKKKKKKNDIIRQTNHVSGETGSGVNRANL